MSGVKNNLQYLFILLFICFYHITKAQNTSELDQTIDAYIQSTIPSEQYDFLLDMMSLNANTSLNQAKQYYEQFNSRQYTTKNKKYPLLAHYISADVLYYHGLKDSSLYHYLSLSELAVQQKEFMLAASGMGNAAYVLSELGDKMGAINLLKQNSEIAQKTGDPRDLADHYYNIANYYTDLEIRDSAIHYFEKTIEIDRIHNNKQGMLYNMHTLLEQYLNDHQEDKALNLCSECIKVGHELQEVKGLSKCYYFQAIALRLLGKNVEAMAAITKAIAFDQKKNDLSRIGKYQKVQADILSELGENKAAQDKYKEAIENAQKSQTKEDLADAYLGLAEFLCNTNRHQQAIYQIDSAALVIEAFGLNELKLLLFEKYSKAYSFTEDFEKVAYYQQKQNEILSDQIRSQSILATEQSKNAFDLFQMESANRALNAEKELVNIKLQRRNNFIIFSAITAILVSGLFYFAYQAQRQKSLISIQNAKHKEQQLQIQVVEKELLALRSQMNPHFLFNSLNSINDYIINEDSRLASRYLAKFSHLMRTILNNSREKLITLEEELKANKLYVEMENLRFSEQFEFEMEVDSNINTQKYLIPSMLIQPYLENAIKHGLRNSHKKGKLSLTVLEEKDNLKIIIEDNGVGRAEAERINANKKGRHQSHAMTITSDRIKLLNQIHEMDAKVEVIDKTNPTGTQIILTIKPGIKSSNPE